jgi:ABC-type sugar transport system ATPase subunit
MSASRTLLEIKRVSKEFPGVRALDGVSFSLEAGEVHALVGENGAGKSTLVKILGGIYQPDDGEIRLDGERVQFASPHDARSCGIGMVHQEPKICGSLSLSENVLMGALPGRSYRIDWRAAHARARELLRRVGLDVDPAIEADRLSIAERQLLQLAKALAMTSRIIILDEPTASLTPVEVDTLFGVVRELQREGVAFIYISHHLDEVFRIAKRVTVLKDGRHVATLDVSATSKNELISRMVGRELGDRFPAKSRTPGEVALQASGVSGAAFRDASFEVRKSEVLGIAGLVGAGRTELFRAICGADPITSGEIRVKGERVRFRCPADAIAHGIAYLAEDRKDSLFMPLSVGENITIAAPEKFASAGVLGTSKQRALAREYIDKLAIRTPSAEQPIMYLSGGNQQKCIFARWIVKGVDIVVFDEPTRGIDVGAKSEIYRLIDALARDGKAVVLISSELPEVLGMADRVLVMSEGLVTGELPGDLATEEAALALAIPHHGSSQSIPS